MKTGADHVKSKASDCVGTKMDGDGIPCEQQWCN
jgi:hypothetical protein